MTAQPSTEIKRGASKGINESGVHLSLPSALLFGNTRHAEDQQNKYVRRSLNYLNGKQIDGGTFFYPVLPDFPDSNALREVTTLRPFVLLVSATCR
jgi:hypothetical protein